MLYNKPKIMSILNEQNVYGNVNKKYLLKKNDFIRYLIKDENHKINYFIYRHPYSEKE